MSTAEPQQSVAVVEPEPEEAVSLETIEPDTEERHRKFHDLYVSESPGKKRTKAGVFRGAQLELSKRSLRHAFVMKEVLGPPKGLDG